MNTSKDQEPADPTSQAGRDLFDFAVDLTDTKVLMDLLPEKPEIKRPTVEYELQILKIILVGWGISYHALAGPHKDRILELYWLAIRDFSVQLTETTNMMTGQAIDYFKTLKERLNHYVTALAEQPKAPEPASVIGPEFAKLCDNGDEIYTIMTGSRMCVDTLASVQAYLKAVALLAE